MRKSQQQIIEDITGHIHKRGGKPDAWYVGTCASTRKTLFGQHKVKQKGDRWIRRRAESAAVAREVQQHFIKSCATDGKATIGDTATIVYAYKKAPHTKP